MGSVYKRKGAALKNQDGQPLVDRVTGKPRRKTRRNYYIQYRDSTGRTRIESSGTSDKRSAERILAHKEREVAEILSGVIDPLQETYRAANKRTALDHLEDYLAACRDKQDAGSLKEKERQLRWLLDSFPGAKLSDIRPDEVDARLSALSEGGAAARTVNVKLECARAFLNWCVRNGRLRSNPLRVIKKRNEVMDRRVVRRALAEDETDRLIEVARQAASESPRARLRPLWYLMALLAGMRRSDLVRLTWSAIDLSQKVPTLTIRGGKAKRRVDRLPLHPAIVEEIRRVRPRDVLPSARVFPRAVTNRTRVRDYERAGIVLLNAAGEVADLHALRTTFATRLALRGVPPAVLMRLMRHSTIELTMRYYTNLDVSDLEARGLNLLEGPGLRGNPLAEAEGGA